MLQFCSDIVKFLLVRDSYPRAPIAVPPSLRAGFASLPQDARLSAHKILSALGHPGALSALFGWSPEGEPDAAPEAAPGEGVVAASGAGEDSPACAGNVPEGEGVESKDTAPRPRASAALAGESPANPKGGGSLLGYQIPFDHPTLSHVWFPRIGIGLDEALRGDSGGGEDAGTETAQDTPLDIASLTPEDLSCVFRSLREILGADGLKAALGNPPGGLSPAGEDSPAPEGEAPENESSDGFPPPTVGDVLAQVEPGDTRPGGPIPDNTGESFVASEGGTPKRDPITLKPQTLTLEDLGESVRAFLRFCGRGDLTADSVAASLSELVGAYLMCSSPEGGTLSRRGVLESLGAWELFRVLNTLDSIPGNPGAADGGTDPAKVCAALAGEGDAARMLRKASQGDRLLAAVVAWGSNLFPEFKSAMLSALSWWTTPKVRAVFYSEGEAGTESPEGEPVNEPPESKPGGSAGAPQGEPLATQATPPEGDSPGASAPGGPFEPMVDALIRARESLRGFARGGGGTPKPPGPTVPPEGEPPGEGPRVAVAILLQAFCGRWRRDRDPWDLRAIVWGIRARRAMEGDPPTVDPLYNALIRIDGFEDGAGGRYDTAGDPYSVLPLIRNALSSTDNFQALVECLRGMGGATRLLACAVVWGEAPECFYAFEAALDALYAGAVPRGTPDLWDPARVTPEAYESVRRGIGGTPLDRYTALGLVMLKRARKVLHWGDHGFAAETFAGCWEVAAYCLARGNPDYADLGAEGARLLGVQDLHYACSQARTLPQPFNVPALPEHVRIREAYRLLRQGNHKELGRALRAVPPQHRLYLAGKAVLWGQADCLLYALATQTKLDHAPPAQAAVGVCSEALELLRTEDPAGERAEFLRGQVRALKVRMGEPERESLRDWPGVPEDPQTMPQTGGPVDAFSVLWGLLMDLKAAAGKGWVGEHSYRQSPLWDWARELLTRVPGAARLLYTARAERRGELDVYSFFLDSPHAGLPPVSGEYEHPVPISRHHLAALETVRAVCQSPHGERVLEYLRALCFVAGVRRERGDVFTRMAFALLSTLPPVAQATAGVFAAALGIQESHAFVHASRGKLSLSPWGDPYSRTSVGEFETAYSALRDALGETGTGERRKSPRSALQGAASAWWSLTPGDRKIALLRVCSDKRGGGPDLCLFIDCYLHTVNRAGGEVPIRGGVEFDHFKGLYEENPGDRPRRHLSEATALAYKRIPEGERPLALETVLLHSHRGSFWEHAKALVPEVQAGEPLYRALSDFFHHLRYLPGDTPPLLPVGSTGNYSYGRAASALSLLQDPGDLQNFMGAARAAGEAATAAELYAYMQFTQLAASPDMTSLEEPPAPGVTVLIPSMDGLGTEVVEYQSGGTHSGTIQRILSGDRGVPDEDTYHEGMLPGPRRTFWRRIRFADHLVEFHAWEPPGEPDPVGEYLTALSECRGTYQERLAAFAELSTGDRLEALRRSQGDAELCLRINALWQNDLRTSRRGTLFKERLRALARILSGADPEGDPRVVLGEAATLAGEVPAEELAFFWMQIPTPADHRGKALAMALVTTVLLGGDPESLYPKGDS